MTSGAPLDFVWDSEAQVLRPYSPYWARRAAAIFGHGESLQILAHQARSIVSHNHYFAVVQEAWQNLPPLMADRFLTAEHLRKYALIQCGYCNSQSMPCANKAQAEKIAGFIRPIDEFSVVTIRGSIVEVFTAKSQAMNAMDKKTFRESKDKVLDYIAGMIGVAKQELTDAAGKAA